MSTQQLNDPTRNWSITAQSISTSIDGDDFTLEASRNINLFSGVNGPTGYVKMNNNAWFDSNANLNFSFGEGVYDNSNITSSSNATFIIATSQLFQTFSFNPSSNKIVQMTKATACNVGSWVVINNFSTSARITIQDFTGLSTYANLSPGAGIKMLAVSSTSSTNGSLAKADKWIGSQNGLIQSLRDADGTIYPDGPIPDAKYSNYLHYNPTSNEVTYIPEVLYVSTPTYILTPGASNQQLTIIDDISGGTPGQLNQFLKFAEAGIIDGQINEGDVFALATDASNIYIGGKFGFLNGVTANSVAKVGPKGVIISNLDSGFEFLDGGIPSSVYTLYYNAPSIATQVLYAGGNIIYSYNGQLLNSITYYDFNNEPYWHSMGAGTGSIGFNQGANVYSITPTTNNATDIYVGGDFLSTNDGSVTLNNICFYDYDNDLFNQLKPLEYYGVTQVSATPVVNTVWVINDYIYVGGQFKSAGGVQANNIARYNTQTGIWEALWDNQTNRNGVNDVVYAITSDPSGEYIYVGGSFTKAGGIFNPYFAYWISSTVLWYLPGLLFQYLNNTVRALEYVVKPIDTYLPSNGDVVFLGGDFSTGDVIGPNYVAGWGVNSPYFFSMGGKYAGNGTNGPVYSLKWVDPPFGQGSQSLFVGGKFTAVDVFPSFGDPDIPSLNIARWYLDVFNKSFVWEEGTLLNNGTNDTVRALTAYYSPVNLIPDSTLYLGGDFTQVDASGGLQIPTNHIAQYNLYTGTWQNLGDNPANGLNGPVYALDINIYQPTTDTGSKLAVGGSFTYANGLTPVNNIAHFDFNNKIWEQFTSGTGGNGVNDIVFALSYGYYNLSDVLPPGATTIMGGKFYLMDYGGNNFPANYVGTYSYADLIYNNLLYLNPSIGVSKTGGFSSIYALKMIGDDLYVGGDFDAFGPNHDVSLNNPNVYNIAKWDTIERVWYPILGSAVTSLERNAAVGMNDIVSTLETNGSKLYVGGVFTNTGKNKISYVFNEEGPLNSIGEWDPNTELWANFYQNSYSSNIGFYAPDVSANVTNIYYDAGTLYATGNFISTKNVNTLGAGELSCNFIAKLNTTSHAISAIDNSLSVPPLDPQNGFCLDDIGQGTGRAILHLGENIYFGGYFNTSAPSVGSYGFSRSSYYVPRILPVLDHVTIYASGCSFINSATGDVTTSYTLQHQYDDVHLIFDTSANAWLILYKALANATTLQEVLDVGNSANQTIELNDGATQTNTLSSTHIVITDGATQTNTLSSTHIVITDGTILTSDLSSGSLSFTEIGGFNSAIGGSGASFTNANSFSSGNYSYSGFYCSDNSTEAPYFATLTGSPDGGFISQLNHSQFNEPDRYIATSVDWSSGFKMYNSNWSEGIETNIKKEIKLTCGTADSFPGNLQSPSLSYNYTGGDTDSFDFYVNNGAKIFGFSENILQVYPTAQFYNSYPLSGIQLRILQGQLAINVSANLSTYSWDGIVITDGATRNAINKNGYTTTNTMTNANYYLNFSDSSSNGISAIYKTEGIYCNPSEGLLGSSYLQLTDVPLLPTYTTGTTGILTLDAKNLSVGFFSLYIPSTDPLTNINKINITNYRLGGIYKISLLSNTSDFTMQGFPAFNAGGSYPVCRTSYSTTTLVNGTTYILTLEVGNFSSSSFSVSPITCASLVKFNG